MAELFARIERHALRLNDARGHLDILYESGACVLKRAFSKAGVFRGMHWQAPPVPQTKMFRIITGRIADFVIDMNDPVRTVHRSDVGPEDGWVRIDANFAHGYYAFEDSVFEYFCDGGYDEAGEQGFNIAEQVKAMLGIDDISLSLKDATAPRLPTPDHQDA